VRIDLHTHSSASDGTEPPARVMRRAADAGLDLVALTDHDTLAGHAEARAALPPGLTLVPGMELSSRLTGRSVHLLCYGVDPADAPLAEECEAIRTDRLRRGRAIVGKLRDLGVNITWEQVTALAGDGVVGRPHIARAMVEAGAISRPEQAFGDDWIGPGGPAYVRRYALDPEVAIGLVRAAGGVVVLAHPGAVSRGWKIPDEVVARLARAGLAGLEVNHPDHDHDERRRLATLAAGLDLVPTGGSDDHGGLTGYRIGCETTAPESFERLMARRAPAGRQPAPGSPAQSAHQPSPPPAGFPGQAGRQPPPPPAGFPGQAAHQPPPPPAT
jgi:3',5'-nucleoside bisphosphate phosphatase